jgi:NADH-quinone oxidoreductase subunit N
MNSLSLELAHALPETILAVGAIVLLLVGAFRGKDSDGPMTELAVAVLGAALVAVILGSHRPAGVVFDDAFIDDDFGDFMKTLSLTGSIAVLMMAGDFLRRTGVDKFEFPILVVLATLGMMMLISANGLIALYLGLELMSLSLYVVAALSRDDARASEAGLKYFVLGALSSGMLLYGASLL